MRGWGQKSSALQHSAGCVARTGEPLSSAARALLPASRRPVHPALPARFQLREPLGRGGMGTVYRAHDLQSGDEVALKLLHGYSPDDRLKLKREFRALSRMVHPNLVNLYELVIAGEACFFTMELVRGVDLRTYFGSFLERGKPCTAADDRRIRDAARQLSLALAALHEDGKLHRDVKPSNVLVTAGLRVVLVDFGLTTSVAPGATCAEELAGTLPYMAPEQLWSGELSPAADWYAFGVTLHEAITGELPAAATSRWKLAAAPPSLRAKGYDVAEDLDALICQLLAADPAQRPPAESISRCLGGGAPGPARAPHPELACPLIGRETELARLRSLYEQEGRGGTALVHVFGASGIGKSTLLRAFADALQREAGPVAVLRARCHPQETVAYNAIDGLIDALSKLVGQLGAPLSALPAEKHLALTRVFPVLARALPEPEGDPGAPPGERELRRQALGALREVLGQLAARVRVVLWIDDVQWADHDSGMVLRELLRAPAPVPLLIVLSYREEDSGSSACLRVLEQLPKPPAEHTHSLHIGPLGPAASERLLQELLPPAASGAPPLRQLVDEARGSPFLLCELARHVASRPAQPLTAGLSLEELLSIRLEELPSPARRLLEVCAVAGAPLDGAAALQAARLARSERGHLFDLERLSMLRTADLSRRRVEIYHDKIRERVLDALSRQERGALHRAIALALLATEAPNPLAAIDHFEAAGDEASVKRHIVAAATHASELLAFDRAARLYRRAIELAPVELPLHELFDRLGTALSSAGRGREAGVAFLQAARYLPSGAASAPGRLTHLKQKAAEHFIQTGYHDEGMRVLHGVFGDLGIAVPTSRERLLLEAAALRLASALRPPRLPKPRPSPPSALELRRFDALWAAPLRINLTEYALPSYIAIRCLREALRLGDVPRLLRAACLEAAYCSLLPGRAFQKRAHELLRLAEALGAETAAPADRAIWLSCRGAMAHYQGAPLQLVKDMDRALALARDTSREMLWASNTWAQWAMVGLQCAGELPELVRRVRAASEDAEARGDRLASPSMLGSGPFVALVLDRPEDALEQCRRALGWAPRHYTVQHFWSYVSSVEAELYRGNAAAAWQATLATWAEHERSGFLAIHYVRDHLLFTRGRAALGRAAELEGAPAAELRRAASRAARLIERHEHPTARAWALLLRAGLACAGGRLGAATAALGAAAHAFECAQMKLYREVARYCLGCLLGGERGRAMHEQASGWMRGAGIVKPHALTQALAPGVLPPLARAASEPGPLPPRREALWATPGS